MQTRTIQIEAKLDGKNIRTKKATWAGAPERLVCRITDYRSRTNYRLPITNHRLEFHPNSTQVQSSPAKSTKIFNSALESLLM
jgi:hypothetical protein